MATKKACSSFSSLNVSGNISIMFKFFYCRICFAIIFNMLYNTILKLYILQDTANNK